MTTYRPRHASRRTSLWAATLVLAAEMFTPWRRADEAEAVTS